MRSGIRRGILKCMVGYVGTHGTNPELRERLASEALEPMPMSPEEFGRHVRDDIARWSRLARDRNIPIVD